MTEEKQIIFCEIRMKEAFIWINKILKDCKDLADFYNRISKFAEKNNGLTIYQKYILTTFSLSNCLNTNKEAIDKDEFIHSMYHIFEGFVNLTNTPKNKDFNLLESLQYLIDGKPIKCNQFGDKATIYKI